MDFHALFLSRTGRISRRTFWIGGGLLLVVGAALGLVPLLGPTAAMGLLWPWYSLSAKRLQDMGRSPTLALVALVPGAMATIAAAIAGLTMFNPAVALMILPLAALVGLVSTAGFLATLAFLAWLALANGTSGPNKWGEAPLSLVKIEGLQL